MRKFSTYLFNRKSDVRRLSTIPVNTIMAAIRIVLLSLIPPLLLSACSNVPIVSKPDFSSNHYTRRYDGPPARDVDVSHVPDAIPKNEPLSRYGNQPSYQVHGKRYHVMHSSLGFEQRGIASWYGIKFHKALTSSGEPYNMYAMTAAHKSLPLPTYVRVRNLENDRTAIVKVNDRGPFAPNRIIDLSYAAAKHLGMMKKGTAQVEITAIDTRHPSHATAPVQDLTDRPAPSHPVRLYLQAGAFSSIGSAEELQNQIQTVTAHPVFIAESRKNGAPFYRVEIGPLQSVAETDALSNAIANAGFDEPIVRFSS